MIAPPFVSVPPTQYGGTELVVAGLIDGIIDRGGSVTLFASGDSRGGYRRPCRVLARFERGVWPPSHLDELVHSSFALKALLSAPGEFDVIHAHTPTFLPLASLLPTPVVYTIHHAFDRAYADLYPHAPSVTYVAISARQLELIGPFQRSAVIHHGVDPRRYRLGKVDPDHVAFLGRLSRVKGPDVAIDVARWAGLRLRIGGRPHEEDAPFFREVLAEKIREPHVEWLGELDHERKVDLLSQARATLFPIDWEEPFGLVAIESMLCGCPVVAFGRGAIPELIDEGITGFIARDASDMSRLLAGPAHPSRFDRVRCREHAARRFSASRMVEEYLRVFQAARAAARAGSREVSLAAPELHA